MGSRCGDIDPAVVLYLQQNLGMGAHQVDELLNTQSGEWTGRERGWAGSSGPSVCGRLTVVLLLQ